MKQNRVSKKCLTFWVFVITAMIVLSAFMGAYAETEKAAEVIEACRKYGISSRNFPDDITAAGLEVEAFEIDAMGQKYTMWLVTVSAEARQREGVEFGWVAFRTPSFTVEVRSRDKASYQKKRDMLAQEAERGSYVFWSPEEKAAHSYALYGEDARIVLPGEDELPEAEARAKANGALKTLLGVTDAEAEELIVECIFYQDETRYWGVTFRENRVDGPVLLKPLYAVVIDGSTGEVEYAVEYDGDRVVEMDGEE